MTKTASELPRGIRLNRSGSYEAMYRGADRKLYSKSFNPRDFRRNDSERERERSKRQAVEAAKQWIEENKPTRGKPWVSPAEGKRSLREVYGELVSYLESEGKPYAPATVALHDQLWKALTVADPNLPAAEIGDLTSTRIDKALSKISKPEMRSKARNLVQRIANYAIFRGYIAVNPVRRGFTAGTREARVSSAQAEGKDERMPSTEEVGKLVAQVPDRYRALLLVLAFEGLRPGEAFGLKVDDLDFDMGTITVRRSLTKGRVGRTKTGQTRVLPMIPAPGMGDLLKAHVERYPSDDGWVFTSDDGSPIESDNFSKRVFDPAAEAAKVNGGITPNQLRHHAASYWIHRGANILQVSKLLGHAKPSITLDVYAGEFRDSLTLLASLGGGDDLPALESGDS